MRPSVESRRREEVLNATWELLTEVGYERVRIADIAQRAGTSTGTIHYYFKTKEEVLAAAFHYAVADSRRRSEEALAGLSDPWERFVALIEAHVPRSDVRKEWLIWLHLWSEASINQWFRSLNEAHYGQWIDLVEGIVRDGQDRGAFRRVDARDFVLRFLTMMDGLVIQFTMGSRELDLARLRDLLFGFAREQLLAEPIEIPFRPGLELTDASV